VTPTGPVRGHDRREVEATVTLVDQWQPVELLLPKMGRRPPGGGAERPYLHASLTWPQTAAGVQIGGYGCAGARWLGHHS